MSDQGTAYERAVLASRADPAMREVVEGAFLEADGTRALRRFEASEHWARAQRLLLAHGVRPGARVLDFGGGRGLLAAALERAGYRAALCEPNPSAVCGAGAAAELRDGAGLTFEIVRDDVATLAGRGFDAVVCRAVLHHLETPATTLAAVRSALAPGAPFLALDEQTVRRRRDESLARERHPFTAYGVDEPAYTVRAYEQMLRDAGFERVGHRFPVSARDHARILRPDLPAPLARVRWLGYRGRALLRHPPGEPRVYTARAPAA